MKPKQPKTIPCNHSEQIRVDVGNILPQTALWWCKNCGAIATKDNKNWTLPEMAKQNQQWVGP